MKLIGYFTLLCLVFIGRAYSQENKAVSNDSAITFKVFGVCEQCKQRIEEALKVKGIKSADWNIDTKILSLSYDPSRISADKIHNKITAAGYDTYLKKAKDVVYNALPQCCHYRELTGIEETHLDRPGSTVHEPADTAHEQMSEHAVKGVVLLEDNQGAFKPLAGASVIWSGTQRGTTTDENGVFNVVHTGEKLVISYAGYASDTILVDKLGQMKIVLASGKQLKEVKVTASKAATYINSIDPFRTINITQKELFKAACCNLSESFETNPSVDVSYNDAVTGSKQIQLLGLAGIYTQLTVENLPGPRGLATSLGLNSIPGTWIESIQMSKGTGSVANGYESIAGQINVELKKPVSSERLYANIYANDFGRTDINLNLTQKLGTNWSTTLLLHDDYFNNKKLDFNKDGFRDLPTGNLFSGVNRWSYDNSKGFMTQFGVKFLDDKRTGGQLDYDAAKDQFTTNTMAWKLIQDG